jgi:hypothetical protein
VRQDLRHAAYLPEGKIGGPEPLDPLVRVTRSDDGLHDLIERGTVAPSGRGILKPDVAQQVRDARRLPDRWSPVSVTPRPATIAIVIAELTRGRPNALRDA